MGIDRLTNNFLKKVPRRRSSLVFEDLDPVNLTDHWRVSSLEGRCSNMGLVDVVVVSTSRLSEDHFVILEAMIWSHFSVIVL